MAAGEARARGRRRPPGRRRRVRARRGDRRRATSACWPASAWARCSCTRGRGSACCPPATSWSRPGEPLAPGQIRDSNRATLLALVAQQGWQAVDLGLIRDDEAAITDGHHRGRGDLRRRAHQRRRVDGRHRPREGGARPHRRHAVDADRHPAGQAVRLRRWWRAARRCSACPATRCRRWSASSCSPARRCAGWPGTPTLHRPDGAGRRRRGLRPAAPTARSTSSGCVAERDDDGVLQVRSAGGQGSPPPHRHGPGPRPARRCPTATASTPATRSASSSSPTSDRARP